MFVLQINTDSFLFLAVFSAVDGFLLLKESPFERFVEIALGQCGKTNDGPLFQIPCLPALITVLGWFLCLPVLLGIKLSNY